VERAKHSGGLHKRSAEDWGVACGREGIPPLSRLVYLAGRGAQELLGGRCGKERPAEVGSEGRETAADGRKPPPSNLCR
jgi:hypothetical protein